MPIFLCLINHLPSLAVSQVLPKPRFNKRIDECNKYSPKPRFKKENQGRGDGGNTGIHGKRTRWGSIPPKEMERSAPEREIRRSPPAVSVAGETRRTKGVSEWVWGRETSPCPRYNPLTPPRSGSTALVGGSTAYKRCYRPKVHVWLLLFPASSARAVVPLVCGLST